MKSKESQQGYVELTTTLMETQEFGEMMEHVDEVNFALDGLKKGQPVRIRRASLLSLLSICGTTQQRRLLRVHGSILKATPSIQKVLTSMNFFHLRMAKTIIGAVLGLSFDDQPSNLAAAALLYILTIDGQEDHLLDSPGCIRFLIKLLRPLSSGSAKEKLMPVGSKLLGLCKNAGFLQEPAKGTDSSSTAIMLKVREILVNSKEMKPRDISDGRIEEPELNPKWISLLTMEKACSFSISIEDAAGALRKTGGNFKEKLREFGGLDAVFEAWLEKSPTFALESKDISGLESLVLLLKCLKIMENATFLSNDNQCHLLGMKGNFDGQQAPRSFTKLLLSIIKILSGVSLLRNSLNGSEDENKGGITNGSSHLGGRCSMEWNSQESSDQWDQCLSPGQQGSFRSSLEHTQVSADPLLLKLRVESSQAGSCSGTSWNSNTMVHWGSFAFDEDDFEPSKWDLLSGNGKKSLSQDSSAKVCGYKDGSHFVPLSSQQESNNIEYHHSQETSCDSVVDEDSSNLLADCLLTAVKVLMNLTNDNPESNTPLTDQELDFLVAILGLLVNLVEKDSVNRSRLAAASVSLPNPEGLDSADQNDVISLLCSIFLANQSTSEAAGEEKCLSWVRNLPPLFYYILIYG
ncbi:UNVERIFIED_CONTAM: hypothetical protein Sangu_2361100 [Sesamum angustifolium]|uniref:Wings apart-like protein C-terminal domain-containing protein n=1 Tax=Sesamum angustifolium TaxID=2727405 RepID=A0AAW2KUF2_9LAMI